jgi:hypothetical protein
MCDIPRMVAGWLIKIVTLSQESTTRRMINWWASWYPDQDDAVAAVIKQTGPYEPQPVAARTLAENELRAMGLSGPGDVRNIKTDF